MTRAPREWLRRALYLGGMMVEMTAMSDPPGQPNGPQGDAHENDEAPRQAPMQYATDLSSVLAFAPRETPLEILQVADAGARAICAQMGLRAGDRIVRHDGRKDHVLVSTEEGRRLRLALPLALLVEVEPALPS